METIKQANYIKALFEKKEYGMTPDVADYTNTYSEARTKEQASAVIEYLLTCDDKEVEKSEAKDMIIRNKKKIVSALNNKKNFKFAFELKNTPAHVTFSKQHLYFIATGEKVEPTDIDNETAELFNEVAKKYVRGLK